MSMSINCFAVPNDVINEITLKYANQATIYGTALEEYAEKLFYWCLILDVALLGIKAALKQEEIANIIRHFVMLILFAGFIFSVIHNYQTWTGNILDGLKALGISISGQDLTTAPFKAGIEITKKILSATSAWQPIDSLGYIIIGCIIMACFAFMTAQIIMIKCEAYIAMNAAVLLLGFGGSSIFREYAINTMRYALSVAFKLFVMQLVLGIGMSFINDFTDTSLEYIDLIVLIGASLVLFVLIKTIPEVCAGVINGSHTGGGGLSPMVSAAAGAAAGAITGSMVGGVRSADTVRAALAMTGPNGEGKTGFARAGSTMSHLWNAHSSVRRNQNARGSWNQRMNTEIKDRRDAGAGSSEEPKS